ncbi:MAG: hypothetical protein AAF982_11500 [Pseudomonadota bacterium]
MAGSRSRTGPQLLLAMFGVVASVAAEYGGFAVQMRIPRDLPPGVYSYFPEIIPLECGVHRPRVPPMFDPFAVIPAA